MAYWFWLGGTALFVVLLMMAALSRIRIRVRYSRSGKLDELVVIARALYGVFHYRAVVPAILMRSRNLVIERKTTMEIAGMQRTGEADVPVGLEKMRRTWAAYRGILHATRHFRSWMRQTLKKVECTRFRLDMRIGTGDAASTAIASGILWILYGCVIGVAGNTVTLKTNPYGAVEPVYQGAEFSLVWEADFQLRLWDAVWSMLKLGARTAKIGQAIRSWRRWIADPETT